MHPGPVAGTRTLLGFLLFGACQGAFDEGGYAVVELLEAFVSYIDHVAGFVPVVLDVFGEGLRDGEMFLLIFSGEEGRGQVVVATVDHDAKAGIGLHGFRQIVGHVDADGIAGVLEIPLGAAEEGHGQIGLAVAVLQVLADVVVEQRDVCGGDGGALRIVIRAFAQRVEIGTGEAGIESARGEVFVFLEGLLELPAVDAEVGAKQVLNR